jgi:hypothetical protein
LILERGLDFEVVWSDDLGMDHECYGCGRTFDAALGQMSRRQGHYICFQCFGHSEDGLSRAAREARQERLAGGTMARATWHVPVSQPMSVTPATPTLAEKVAAARKRVRDAKNAKNAKQSKAKSSSILNIPKPELKPEPSIMNAPRIEVFGEPILDDPDEISF